MRYTLRQLGYFVAAGEAGSILKALVYIFLEEDLPAMTLGIATLKKAQFSPAQDSFIAYCGKSVSNDEIPGMTPPGLTSN